MSILLVRHSETEWNRRGLFQGHSGSPLTVPGNEQSAALLKELKHYQVRCLIGSDLERAQKTSEVIYNQIGCSYYETALLRERSFGEAEGCSVQEVLGRWPEAAYPNRENWINFDLVPAAEKKLAFSQRIVKAYDFIISHECEINEVIVVVSHACVIEELFVAAKVKFVPSEFLPGRLYSLE